MAELQILELLLHGKRIGTITHLGGDRNIFAFEDAYIDNPHRPVLSLSFKNAQGELITDIKSSRTRLPPFFSNMLPEGPMRGYLAARAQVDTEREFFLLRALGKDLPGAVTVRLLRGALPGARPDSTPSNGATELDEAALRFSLAGIQLKFSAIEEAQGGLTIPANGIGGAWIVKLPSTTFAGIPENEYSMMELARRMGMNVPQTQLLPLDQLAGLPSGLGRLQGPALAVKRFDRDEQGGAIHIEDFAQVFGVYPDKKYRLASYRNIVEVLLAETREADILEFLRRFVFNALIGNGDMHLKNWSLIYPDKTNAALAPAYDFVSTLPYLPNDELALTFVDSKKFESLSYEQFKRFAAKALLSENMVLGTVRDVVSDFADAWRHADDLPISEELRAAIKQNLRRLPLYP